MTTYRTSFNYFHKISILSFATIAEIIRCCLRVSEMLTNVYFSWHLFVQATHSHLFKLLVVFSLNGQKLLKQSIIMLLSVAGMQCNPLRICHRKRHCPCTKCSKRVHWKPQCASSFHRFHISWLYSPFCVCGNLRPHIGQNRMPISAPQGTSRCHNPFSLG